MNSHEDKEQMAVIEWASFQPLHNGAISKIGDYLIAIPNEGKRSPKAGNKFKKLGLKPGVSDLFLALPRSGCHGLWIEMKKQRQHFRGIAEQAAAVTESQRDWINRMNRTGYDAYVCYGADEAIRTIKNYLEGKNWLDGREDETSNAG